MLPKYTINIQCLNKVIDRFYTNSYIIFLRRQINQFREITSQSQFIHNERLHVD